MIRSTRRLRHGLAILPMLLVGLPSQAALIDLGNVTRDTDNGLDWLDLTQTQGFTRAEVAGGAGGFLAQGWSIASETQVCGLFSTHANPSTPCPGQFSSSVSGNVNELLIDLMGPTLVGPQSKESSGFYDNGTAIGGFGYVYYNHVTNTSETKAFDSPFTLPGASVFLSQTVVPEPSTALLFAMGGLALALRRRSLTLFAPKITKGDLVQ